MHYKTILKLQEEYGIKSIQDSINDGSIWKMEGSGGREAMDLLARGVCMLPKTDISDYYGNIVPSRDRLLPGTKGTFLNSSEFWDGVLEGSNEVYDNFDELDVYE